MYLLLSGTHYPNESVISVSDIGISDPTNNGLQCITDKMPCCDRSQTGMWFFPDGEPVPAKEKAASYYVSRGHNDGTVTLNRLSSSLMPTGKFCCVIPDALEIDNYLCITLNGSKSKSGSIIEIYSSLLIKYFF